VPTFHTSAPPGAIGAPASRQSRSPRWWITAAASCLVLAAHETPATAGYLIDPTGGTVLWGDSFNVDDQTVRRSLGFTASLFGTPFTEVDVSTNGNLNFSANVSYNNQAFPTGAAMIAPLWDDHYIYAGTGQKITEKAVAGQYYSVTWDVSQFSNNLPRFQFQVVLFGGTTTIGGTTFLPNDIAFAYQRVDADFRGGNATLGLNKGDGTFSTLPSLVGSGGYLGNAQTSLLPTAPGSVLLARYDGSSGYGGSLTTAVVPEPGACVLALLGLGCAGFTAWRRSPALRRNHQGGRRGVSIVVAAVVVCSLLAARHGAADVVTLNASDTGWYRSDGYHDPTNSNYVVGDLIDGPDEYRNFFVFDTSSLTQAITAATLKIWNPAGGYASTGLDSPGYERYTLFDVTTDLATLTGGFAFAGASTFFDLANGATYGEYVATIADNNSYVYVPLNAAGVAALNAADGMFALGGAITTLNNTWDDGDMLFGYSGGSAATLVMTVPEPSTYAMALAGIACAAWGTFRRRGIPHLRAATTIAFAAVVVLGAAVGQAATVPTLFLRNVDTATNKSQILRFDATTGASLGNFLVGYDGAFIGGYTFGPDGNLYVSDFNGFTIDRYSGTTGAFLDTFATVTSSAPYQPLFGPDGNLYLGQSTGRITKYDGTTGQSLGVFVAPPTGVFDFGGMAFRGGSLYVSYIGSSGSLYRYDAATGGNRQQVYSGFSSNGPRAPVFDNGGTMYVPDWQTNKIYKFNETSLALTGTITTAAGISPRSLAFDPTGVLLVLSDNGVRSQINRYDRTTGAFLDTLVAPGTGGLGRAGDMILMVPEPSACVLGAAGLVCVGWAAWRRRRGMAAIRGKTLS